MSLSVMSPLAGDFKFDTLAFTGTIAGDARGDLAVATITITGSCPGTLTGTLLVEETVTGTSVAIAAAGSDCNGPLEFSGVVDADDSTTVGG